MQKEMTIEEYDGILEEYMRAGVLYACGGQLEPLTKSVLDAKRNQYPDWYKGTSKANPAMTRYGYLASKCDKGFYIGDCCGVIKGIRMGNRVGKPHVYIRAMDETIEDMRKSLECVMTKQAYDAPHGYLMVAFDDGHVATVGMPGLTDIESAESCDGLKEVPLKYQNTSPNTYWKTCGALPWIDYSSQDKKEPVYKEKVGDVIPMRIERIENGIAYGSAELQPDKIVVGSKVTIDKGAKSGGLNSAYRGKTIDSRYANGSYVGTVSKIESHYSEDEALIKELNTWIAVKYLNLA